MNSKARMNRMFAQDGRCVNIAADHGFFGEFSFLNGIEDMSRAVSLLVAANPDAIQLTPSMAHLLQSHPGPKPALVLRVDTANVYGSQLPRYLFNKVIASAVEQALALDAVCICTNLLQIPDQPEVHGQCIENINALKPECDRYGMLLMVEPLVFQPNAVAGGYMVDGDIRKIMSNVRQAVELGADVVKADPCNDVREYHRVIEVAGGRPVLVRGGSKASDEEILSRTEELMKQAAAGIVYGRNVIQHSKTKHIVSALLALVHQGATYQEALEKLG